MMQIDHVGELPQSYVDAAMALGANAVAAKHIPVLYVRTDRGQPFRGCHVYDKSTGSNLIVINANLTGIELKETLLHEAWHLCNGDGSSQESESVIEERCCRITGT